MKKRNLVLALALAGSSATALADGWSFANVSVNFLDWTSKTETRTNRGPFGQKKDFVYLELEGGRGGDWGDVYGFLDLENPTKNSNNTSDPRANRRTAAKVALRYTLAKAGELPIMAYAHVYDFRDNGFYDQNRVLGVSTNLTFGKLWVHPFIGAHQELKAGVGAKMNGGMAGYVAGYSFDALGQSFSVTQWHETEFGRKAEYRVMADEGAVVVAGKTGQNGAVSLWWNVNKQLTTGLSYRYADNKLGVAGYEDALIYTLKYNFF
jgi:hypothetical protein